MDKVTKDQVLALIKDIDINDIGIPKEANIKWYKFGAYHALSILSDKVNNIQLEEKQEEKKDGSM